MTVGHSVRQIVALITLLACMQFNIRPLIFYVCEGSSQPIEPIKHAKKYRINIFYYEGHNL